ncbi:hypothetical protein SLS57_002778 [Botryosphaeria dothidea]
MGLPKHSFTHSITAPHIKNPRSKPAGPPFGNADPIYHAKVFNGVVYTTGQIGADVVGNLVSKDIKPQTEQVLKNLSAILEAAGSSLDRVIKVNIYMVDQTEYAGMNEVYKEVRAPHPGRHLH